MKIQCDVCARAEAAVLCCADEAALCWACDDVIHAANKLAGKHQRVPLLPPLNPSSSNPLCDICQEKSGFFFCLEDRALLCRTCDVAIHTSNNYVSEHQRFLITGIKLASQNSLSNSNSNNSNNNNCKGKWTNPGFENHIEWGISDPGSSGLTGSKGSF